MLVEVFFLHERGTVFNTFLVWSTSGTVIGPTLGGFTAEHAPWPWEFWWTVALQGAFILLGMYCKGDFGDVKKLIKVCR
jgi:MFS family permease